MAKQDKKSSEAGKKMFNDVTDSSIDAKNAVDEFYKSLLKGGKKAQPVLDELSKLFSKTGDASAKASKKMKTVSEDLDELANTASQGQKQFKSLQKTLATYDGPAFKAAGMITEELSTQLSYNEMLAKSKSSLNELDANAFSYSKLLSDSSKELIDIDNARYESVNQLNDIKSKTNSLTGELIGLLQDENVLQDLQAENESKRFDLIQKINQEADPNVRNKLEDELLGYMQEGLDLEKEIFENKKNQVNVNNSLQASLETEANLNRDLQVLSENRLNTEKDIAFQSAINNDQTGKLKSTFENINEITNQQIDSQGTLAKRMQEVEQSAFNVGTSQYRQIDLTDDINDKLVEQRNLEAARSNILDTNNGLTATQRQEALALIDANIAINREQLNTLNGLQKASDAYAMVQEKAEGMRDTIMTPVDKLFGIVPSGLSKMLGLDVLKQQIGDKVFGSIAQGFITAGGGAAGFFSAASAGAATLMASLAPILPILLAIAAVVGIVKLFSDADKEVSQLARDLNVGYQEAIKIKGAAVDMANEFGNLGIDSKELTKSMVELTKATGMNVAQLSQTNAQADNLVKTTALLNEMYGTSTEETLALNSAAAITGTSVDKMAAAAGIMGDKFMPAQEIISEIGKVSKGVLFNFRGNTSALVASIKKAKMLGTTLNELNTIGEGLMNIESQIAAQNKARIMLGKNINMDAARYFYMTGQTEKMMDAMVQQMGSAAEYEKLGPYQRKIYAEAMGMGVDQLDNMMAKQLELEQMGINAEEHEKILQSVKEKQLSIDEALLKVKDGEGRKILENQLLEQQRAGAAEKLSNTLSRMGDLLFKIIEPILPIVDEFVKSLGTGTNTLTGMGNTFKTIGEAVSASFSVILQIIQPIIDIVKELFTAISSMGTSVGSIGASFKDVGVAIMTYLYAPYMVAYKAIAGFVQGIMPIIQSILGLVSPILDLFTSTTEKSAGLSTILFGIGDIIQTIFKYLGYVFSAILTPLGSLIKGVLEPLKGIFGKIVDAFSPITELFKSSGKEGKSFFETLKPVLDIFQKIGNVLGTVIAASFDIVINAIKQTINVVMGLWDIISGIFTLDGEKILKGLSSIGGAIIDLLIYPFKKAYEWIMGLFGGNSPSELGLRIIDGISSIGSMLIDVLTAPFTLAWDFIGSLFNVDDLGTSIVDGFKSILGSVGDFMLGYLSGVWDIISGIFTLDGDKILAGLNTIGDSILKLFDSAWNGIKSLFGELPTMFMDALELLPGFIWDTITAPFTMVMDWIGDLFGVSNLGSKILDPIKNIFTSAGNFIMDYLGGVWDIISGLFTLDFDKMFEGISNIGSMISDAFSNVSEIIMNAISYPFEKAISFITDLFGEDVGGGIGKVLNGIKGAITTFIIKPFEYFKSFFSGISKMFSGDFVGGIKEIGNAVLQFILTPFKMIGDFIDSVFGTDIVSSISDVFSSIGDSILNILGGVWDVIAGIFTLDGDRILEGLSGIGNAILGIFQSAWDGVTGLFGELPTMFMDALELLPGFIWDTITAPFVDAVNWIGELFGMGDLGSSIIDGVSDVFSSIGDFITDYLGGIWDIVAGIFTFDGDRILEGLNGIGNAILNLFSDAWDGITSMFSGLGDYILDGISSIGTDLYNFLTQPFSDAWDWITGWFGGNSPSKLGDSILVGLESVATPITDVLKAPFEALATLASTVLDGISGIFESIAVPIKAVADLVTAVGNAVSNVINTIADSIVKISGVDGGNLLQVGGGLTAVGFGLAALTGGDLISALGNFLTGGPMETLTGLQSINGNAIKETANGVSSITTALKDFSNIDTEPINKTADALNKFNDQVIKGGLADALNSFLGSDPFAVFNQLAAIDTAKIDTVATSIALAGTSIETFNQKMSALDDSIADKGDIIATLLNDIADIEHDEIDALASAIDNLSKSYDNLMTSMKKITDDDIARMQQIASATPKDVSGGGITDVIGNAIGDTISGVKDLAGDAVKAVGSFFGFGSEEEQPTSTTATTEQPISTVTPVQQQPATVVSATPGYQNESVIQPMQSSDNKGVEALLRELISKLNQPVQLKIGDGAIRDIQSAITLNRSYTANVNGYRP